MLIGQKISFGLILLVVFGLETSVFAHSDTDWREDKKAFESHRTSKVPVEPIRLLPTESPTEPPTEPLPERKLKANVEFEATKKFLIEKLRIFSGVDSVVLSGASVKVTERKSLNGKDAARALLREEFTKLGFVTSIQSYASNGKNFIAEKLGVDPSRVVILSAHIDSVGNAGADDNGSGVVGALSVAKLLKDLKFTYTLRFVGFDEEEIGLVGSTQYLKSLTTGQRNQIVGLINFEMLAYNARKDGAFHVIDCARPDSISLSESVLRAVKTQELPLRRSAACTDRSDHSAFWKAGIPAIVISQNFFGGDSNPCYHKACDQVSDKLNFDYMTNIVLGVRGAVAEILIPASRITSRR